MAAVPSRSRALPGSWVACVSDRKASCVTLAVVPYFSCPLIADSTRFGVIVIAGAGGLDGGLQLLVGGLVFRADQLQPGADADQGAADAHHGLPDRFAVLEHLADGLVDAGQGLAERAENPGPVEGAKHPGKGAVNLVGRAGGRAAGRLESVAERFEVGENPDTYRRAGHGLASPAELGQGGGVMGHQADHAGVLFGLEVVHLPGGHRRNRRRRRRSPPSIAVRRVLVRPRASRYRPARSAPRAF